MARLKLSARRKDEILGVACVVGVFGGLVYVLERFFEFAALIIQMLNNS